MPSNPAPHTPRADARVDGRVVLMALGCFWLSFILLNTVRAAVLGDPHQDLALVRRVIVAGVGAALSWIIYRVLRWRRPVSFRAQIGLTIVLSLPAAFLFACSFVAFNVFFPLLGKECPNGCTPHFITFWVSELMVEWTFVFAAWCLLYLSLVSANAARIADQRAAAHLQAARLAEIRALRYQINPHFLFNLLNSLTTFIVRRELAQAEALVGDMGRFFRHSLAADPVADAILADELEMQSRYLDLERRRFPERMLIRTDIAEDVLSALVPSLILQPLVENAVKHGVGRTSRPVTITISAAASPGERLRIIVEDDAVPDEDSPAPSNDGAALAGLGVGLRNVADRLDARFGAEASCIATSRPDGGFRVELIMPLLLA